MRIAMRLRTTARTRWPKSGYAPARASIPPTSCRPARWATWSPTSATSRRRASATRCSTPTAAAPSCCPATATCKSMVFAGLYPTDSRSSTRTCATRSTSCSSTTPRCTTSRRRPRAGLRLPLRVPRPAAHGDRAGAAGAGVRARPRHHGAERGVRRLPHRRRRAGWSRTRRKMPHRLAGGPHRGAVREGPHHLAGRVHRRDDEAGQGAPRRLPRHEVPRPGRGWSSSGSSRWPRSFSTSTTS